MVRQRISTTLIYHYDMDNHLDYLVDDFEAKQNLFSLV